MSATHAEAEDSTASSDGPAPSEGPLHPVRLMPAGPRARLVVLGVLLLCVVSLVVAAGVTGHRWWVRGETDAAAAWAPAVAADLVPKLLTFDHRTIDADVARINDLSVGAMADQNRVVTEGLLKPAAIEGQASASAQVAATGLVSASPGRAVVLVFFTQSTTSSQLVGPRVDNRSARVAMVAGDDGVWRAESFEPA